MIRVDEKNHKIEFVTFYDLSDVDQALWEIDEPTHSLSKKEKWDILKQTVEEFQYEDTIVEEVFMDRLVSNVTDALACKGLD